MALSLKYYNEMLPEGEEVDLGGFLVENGGDAVELTKEQEAMVMSRTAMMPADHFGESEDVEVSGTPFLKQSDLDEMHPQPVEVGVETSEIDEAAVAKEAAANKKAKEGGDTS
jgi:hypothetical protein